jgi:hypothetical protein
MDDKHKAATDEHEMDAWLAHLVRSDDNPEVDEMAALRQIMVDAERQDGLDEEIEHDWQRLRFLIKREERAMSSGMFVNFRYAAQAAMVLVAVLGVYFMLPGHEGVSPTTDMEEPVMRGKNSQPIYSKHVREDAEDMYQRLINLGVNAKKTVSVDKVEIQVNLIYPLSVELTALLQGEDISIPRSGDLYLVYLPAAQL